MGVCGCYTPKPGGCPACNPGGFDLAPKPITPGRVDFVPQGCICPPTSEQTCRNPLCPRGGAPLAQGLPFVPTGTGSAP